MVESWVELNHICFVMVESLVELNHLMKCFKSLLQLIQAEKNIFWTDEQKCGLYTTLQRVGHTGGWAELQKKTRLASGHQRLDQLACSPIHSGFMHNPVSCCHTSPKYLIWAPNRPLVYSKFINITLRSIIRMYDLLLGKWWNAWKWLFIDELMAGEGEFFTCHFCLVRLHEFDFDKGLQPKYNQLINNQ